MLQTPAGGGCSGDGSAAGSGPVDVVGTGAGGGGATAKLADLRKAVTTLEDSARGARRVYGSSHPFADGCECYLRILRAALAARETPSPGSS